ncbi:MAG: hypothetical protein QOE96_3758 [Blastocatellia bacterium]|jgi:hypothetical protein|nr:hypothetical protein [Blastocatellia bacterium]
MKNLKKFFRNHDEFCFVACSVLIIAAIAGSIYGYVHHVQTKARNQAVARAKQMDGRTYMINNVAWNWIGDTKLILKNEQGADAGWVMIHFENPLDSKINPLTLALTKPHSQIPLPMKVKAHFRRTPWVDKYDGNTHENFTGSFVEFEIL